MLIVDVHLRNAIRVVQAGNAHIANWKSAVVGSGARGRKASNNLPASPS